MSDEEEKNPKGRVIEAGMSLTAGAGADTIAETLKPGPRLLSLPRVQEIRQYESEHKPH